MRSQSLGRTGFPWTPTVGFNDLNTGGDGTPVRPDRLQDGRLDNGNRARWFDPFAFQRVTCNIPNRPDLCHYGSAGRNIMTSPGQQNLDFSLFKNFRVTERFKVQFRAEAFNITNTPYFGQPNNGVGDFQGGLHEHLYLNNGPVDSVVTSAKGGLFEAISDGATPVEQRVDRLFLSLLNREPTSDERQRFGEHLKIKDEKKGDARREAMWVLMTCSEFRFNH